VISQKDAGSVNDLTNYSLKNTGGREKKGQKRCGSHNPVKKPLTTTGADKKTNRQRRRRRKRAAVGPRDIKRGALGLHTVRVTRLGIFRIRGP